MALDNLRRDTTQGLRYHPEEITPMMRAVESMSLRMGAAYLSRMAKTMPVKAGDETRQIAHIMARMSDARLRVFQHSDEVEEVVAAGTVDALLRWFAGEPVDPSVLEAATDTIISSLKYVDMRTDDAGIRHPSRLEVLLARGD